MSAELATIPEVTESLLTDLVTNNHGTPEDERINKAAFIRRAMSVLGVSAKPSEIAEWLKENHNLTVTPAYISVIKGQSARQRQSQSFEALRIAKRLVRECGGYSAARAALDALMEEQEMVAETRNRYTQMLADIDLRLSDEERPLGNTEKRELLNDKRKVQKLLDSLDEIL